MRTRFSFVPPGEHRLRQIYERVKAQYAAHCDDSYLCCDHHGQGKSGDKGPEWTHCVRTALNDLKQLADAPVRRGSRRGTWIVADGSKPTSVPSL